MLKVKGEFAYCVGPVHRRHAAGAPRCAARTRAPGSGASTSARRWPCPASTPCSPTTTCPGASATGWRTPTSRCWRSTRCATRASRWRSSPPTTPRPPAGRPTRSWSTTSVLEPLTDAERGDGPRCARAASRHPTPRLHGSGNVLRHVRIRHGDHEADGRRRGHRRVRGRHAGPGLPRAGVGARGARRGRRRRPVRRHPVAARRPGPGGRGLGLPPEKVRLTLAGVGGAFGGREDLSMQVHACLLALHTGAPVKMVYNREESFFGHVHRHPARCATSTAPRATGGWSTCGRGSSSTAAPTRPARPPSCGNAGCFACGPYEVPNASIDAYGVYTNNPPCGAMRGFGAVQARFAHEAQMDKLAAALGMDPVELRIRNAHEGPTAACPPASSSTSRRRWPSCSRASGPCRCRRPRRRDRACPAASPTPPTARACGAASATASGSRTSASPRASTTTRPPGCGCRWRAASRSSRCTPPPPRSARARHGAGADRAHRARRRARGRARRRHPGRLGGSTSASRQTYITGGAVKAACEAVRERLEELAAERGVDIADLAAVLEEGEAIEETVEWRHRPTHPARRGRPGRRPRAVRLLGAPRGRRRRHRARAGEGGRAGHRAGRRQGDQPAGARGPDPGRHRAGPGPGADGGDPGRRRQGPQPVLHRLPDPHHPRHAADADRGARARRPARAVRPAGRRRAAQHLHAARHRRRAARRHRARARARPGAPRAPRRARPRRRPSSAALRRRSSSTRRGSRAARGRAARSRPSTTCTPRSRRRCARRPASASSR